jgi:hypothetical protein
MSENNDAALLISQSVAAMITAMGMYAENQDRLSKGHTIAYGEEAFNDVISGHQLHWNQALGLLRR